MKTWLTQTHVLWDISLPFSPLDFLLRFLLPILCFILTAHLLSLITRKICKKIIHTESKYREAVLWTRRILRLLVFVGVLLSLGSLLGVNAYETFGKIFRVLGTPFFSSGKTSISVLTLLLVIPVIITSSWIGRLVKRGFETGMLKHFGLNDEQEFSISRLIRIAVMVIMFFFGLSVIGIDFTAIGVFFGIVGVGIGFGLQSIIADFFAGLSLIGMRLIKEGDRIRVGDHSGEINHVGMLTTELTTYENETLLIPNSHLTGGVIHSYNYKDRRVVIVNSVDVSYESDLDRVVRVLHDVAENNPWLHPKSEILVRVYSFGDSGIKMEMRTWINDVADKWRASSWTNMEIWRRFRTENIQIPFPQRVVHQAADPPVEQD